MERIHMKFKKLVSCAIVTAMVASTMAGCGSNTNIEDTEVAETEAAEATESVETEAETETETEESVEETTEEEVDTETEEESKVEVESTTSNAEEKSEATKEENKSSNNSAKVEETPAHTHSWDGGTVTQAATCTSSGVKTYTCSCGQTKTEAIGATGHNWVAQTTTVHHDAEGMYQQVQTGEQNVVYCNCGEVFYTNADLIAHDPNNFHGYTVRSKPVYETKWVETSPAWDETVTTGYICSICGATQ
jgi:hypothetical protein